MAPERTATWAWLIAAALAGGAGCANDWRTDLWYQPSLRPQAAPRPEPEGSVPVQGIIFAEEREDLEDLADPTEVTPGSLANGKRLFEIHCSACHGMSGHGAGPISKLYPEAPDLRFESIKRRSDGFIFGTLTLGGRAMPAMHEGLTPAERWDVIHYVRQIQREAKP
jgi:mono/diheme cytochrome c family protein